MGSAIAPPNQSPDTRSERVSVSPNSKNRKTRTRETDARRARAPIRIAETLAPWLQLDELETLGCKEEVLEPLRAELRKLKIDDIQDQLNDLKSAKAAAAASPPSPAPPPRRARAEGRGARTWALTVRETRFARV